MKGRTRPKWKWTVAGDRGRVRASPSSSTHQPGTDVAAEPGGQFAGAAVDPGPDRRGGVVVQHPQLGEDLRDPGG